MQLQSWKLLREDSFTKKYIMVTRNVAQYPLHVTYAVIKFEVARSNGLGGDTFTRNVMDARTHRQTNDGPTLVRN